MSGGRSENTLVLALQLVLLSLVCIPSIFGNSAHGAQAGRKLSTEIPGFISIDCGVDQDYYDENNGIYYKSDMEFIDTGKNMPGAINSPNRRMWNLRSFPEGIKNCYSLKPENGKGEMYLIRAHFVYGNYDGKNQPPTFDLYLGVNKWVTVSTKTENYQEIIHYSLTDKINVCLINTGLGIPFISVLLLRHLNNSIYKIEPGALATVWRYDVGGSEVIRYKDDVYDRLWNPPNDLNWFPISTQSTIDTQSSNYSYFPPEVVLKTAARSQNYSVSLDYVLTPDDKTSEYYIIFHFAEIELLEDGQQRELNISLSGEYPLLEPIKLEYLKPLTIGPLNWKVKDEKLAFSIYPTKESKLSPILNAVELFKQILLPNSTTDQEDAKKKRKFVVPVVASIVSLLIVFLLNALFWIFWNRKRIIQGKNADSQKEDLEVPLFDLATIASATNNFSLNNKLGEGGFGPVFKGTLEGGQEIAVKKLSKTSRQGLDEFKNEVSCIAKLQHRNLVKLLGYCIQEETMLIYEYMINKSLDFFIFDQARSMLLDWHKRYHIINGIARGLLYLHQDSRLRIIHRDLKASNILLDDDMNPKISDFGLARIFEGNENEANTNRLVGTRGYMSPEYQAEGLFSVKSDVFSFGVMVLEIVSGKRNRGYYGPEDNLNLLGHAWRLFGEGRSLELSDAAIGNSCNLSEVLRSIHVGLLCVQQRPNDRPTMSSVVVMLSSESALPQPKQPGFFHERDMFEASSQYKPCSGNEVTLTLLSPR